MSFNKKFFTTGGIVASTSSAAPLDPLQNFETVTYTGNGGTQKITGYIRKGAAFNGSSSYIDTGMNLNTTSVSVSLWVKTTDTNACFFGTNTTDNQNRLYLGVNGGNYWIGAVTTNVNTVSASALLDNQWHNVILTLDGSNAKYYMDGTEVTSASYSGGGVQNLNALIGTFQGSGGVSTEFLTNGNIDQVRIFNRALSQSEVDTLEAETYASSTKSTTDIFGDGSGVALYELDKDANDTGVPIDIGQSAVFDGSSSNINVNSIANVMGQVGSISAWVNVNNFSTKSIFGIGLDTNNFIKLEVRTNNNNCFSLGGRFNGTNKIVLSDSTTLNTGQWYHVVGITDGSTYKIYVDGQLQSLTVLTGTNDGSWVSDLNGTADKARIGSLNRTGSEDDLFDGKIDQVRIYSSALSSSDVTNLYNESSVPTANLLAHYKLDGDATDETTNYNGTWGGTEAYSDPAIRTYNGTPTNVNFLGMAFQPDFVWIKQRDNTRSHRLTDSVRGPNKIILSNDTSQELIRTDEIGSFDSNGFTIGANVGVNDNTGDYVAWCWKAGGAAVLNEQGDIDSQVSANKDAGFSIVSYTGNGTAGATIGHGIDTPELIIVKELGNTNNWQVYSSSTGATKFLYLNSTIEALTATNRWNDTTPTSTVFTVGNSLGVNRSSGNFIAYCFHSVDGYQKIGSFQGTGNTSGNIVTTGFRPRFLMWKTTSITGNWQIVDSIRSPLADKRNQLYADLSQGEDVVSYDIVDFNDDGFQMKQQYTNKLNETYIYLAIA